MLAAPVVPNIGPRQRAFRRKLGIVFAVVTLAAGVAIYFLKWSPFMMAVGALNEANSIVDFSGWDFGWR